MTLPDFDAAALELVSEMGTTGTYISVSKGSYDPETGTVVPASTPQTVKLAVLDLTLQSNGLSLKYGTEVLAGDKEVYMIPPQKTGGAAISVNPGADKVVVGGVTYTVVTFKEVNPTMTDPVVFFLYVRR